MIIASIYEGNDCHNPEGPGGGQFCGKDHGPRSGLGAYPHAKHSKPLPSYLKQDVLRARRAGIEVHHMQQPEPVRDVRGKIHDPLALSNAKGGEARFEDDVAGFVTAPRGRIVIATRGGEFEPTEIDYSQNRFGGVRKKKSLTPADLTDPATPDDVTSTFRHEMGHILDQNFKGTKNTPPELARELRAWTYAVEASPDHTVSARMVRNGLESHAYAAFRKQAILADPDYAYLKRGYIYDQQDSLDRVFTEEVRNGKIDAASAAKADAFTARSLKALNKYGEVLRRKGVGVPEPPIPTPYIPKSTRPVPGPGRGSSYSF